MRCSRRTGDGQVDARSQLNAVLAGECPLLADSGQISEWPLPTQTVIRGVDLRSIEDTAVIELLLTRPERKVER